MGKRRTWLWIIGGVAVAGLLMLIAVAGAGIYFVSSHVSASTSGGAEASSAFASIVGKFEERGPLFEINEQNQPQAVVPLSSLPTASHAPSTLMVQAWNPDDAKLVRLSLPFWLLRFSPDRMHVSSPRHHGFDFSRLHLDLEELERIGPALVLDYRAEDGLRVLLWTE